MVQKAKINVKERFYDGEVDLSMSDLDEVPVKEIATLKKTTSLDLSNNRLTFLPSNFTILTNLTKLDLSKNELSELPEDFGSLSKLRYLDLYKNNLERLPLSFGQLGGLKFLDLKDNPLIPAIAKVAGPCVDTKGCQQCARDIVTFYRKLQEEVDNEVEMRQKARQKQLEINQQKKQEEKKKLKKEKQNNKPKKNAQENDHKGSENTKKQSKKEPKVNKNTKKQRNPSNTMWSYFIKILFVILFVVLYRSSSIWYPIVQEYYQVFLDKLPPNVRYYVEALVDNINFVYTSMRSIITNFLSKNELIQSVSKKVTESMNGLLDKVYSLK